MQFEAEWHAVPLGRLCCLAGIYSVEKFESDYISTEIYKVYVVENMKIKE